MEKQNKVIKSGLDILFCNKIVLKKWVFYSRRKPEISACLERARNFTVQVRESKMPFLTLHCCLRILHQNCEQHIFL